jgi:serine/threonine protein phosphatase PrpC
MSRIHGALRPADSPPGQDRWRSMESAVVVLDGASNLDPDGPPVGPYVDHLLDSLSSRLSAVTELQAALRDAIDDVARQLHLTPGHSPSSTVVLARQLDDALDLAVLGDSTAIVGLRDGQSVRLTDDRLITVAQEERQLYRARLREGSGYDLQHRRILNRIQQSEQRARNRNHGYWIAEADPCAAQHALRRTIALRDINWCVLATDGAQRVIDHLGIPWADVAKRSSNELAELLDTLHEWETTADPDGASLPRSKRHDDKTLVTWLPE